MPPIEPRNLAKIKYTTETVYQLNSSWISQQNIEYFCSYMYEGHTVYVRIFAFEKVCQN